MAIVSKDVHVRVADRAFDELGRAFAGLTFAKGLRDSSAYLSNQAKDRFNQQASPDGVKWAPLKRARNRKRDKAKNKRPDGSAQGGQKILYDRGLLMGSMAGRAGGRGAIRQITALSLEHGTNVHYGPHHQFGTKHMPARPFLGITQADADKIARFIEEDIVRQLGF